MDEPMFGHGLSDLLEIQQRWNEIFRLLMEHVRQSAPEDPFQRLQRISNDLTEHSDDDQP